MKFRNFVGVFLASFIRLSQFGKHFTDYVESENQFVQFQLTKNKPVNGSGTSKGGPPPPQCFPEWIFRFVQIQCKIAASLGLVREIFV